MMKLISKPWDLICWLWGLAFPMFSGEGAKQDRANPVGRWLARFILVLAVLLVLGLINNSRLVGVPNWIRNPTIGKIWLPLFGLCIYGLLWLGWWLYRILSLDIPVDESEFPDIDRAWAQALDALSRADIRLDSTPLFLVLGWNTGPEDALFQAAGIRAKVNQVPRDDDEVKPLHVTADRDSIWLTCAGASWMGRQNPALMGYDDGQAPLATMMASGADPFATIGLGQVQGFSKEALLESAKNYRGDEPAAPRFARGEDRERCSARLRHLCRLIKRDRLGFCPVNGILVLLPVTAADPKNHPDETAEACRSDITEALGIFRMRCPVLVMVPDLQRIDGFTELVRRLPEGQRGKRMGQRFPLIADLADEDFPAKVESSVDWIVNSLFGSMVYSMFGVESSRGSDEVYEALQSNQQLFRFYGRIRERRERLAKLVRRCIPNLPGNRVMFGGCYFAATGDEPGSEQAFASGVLDRLIKDQDNVTWTEEAIREDVTLLRTARTVKLILGGVIALLIVGILVLLVSWLWNGPTGAGAPPE